MRCALPFCLLTFISLSSLSFLPRSVDPFTRKEWFALKAPKYFEKRVVGQTPATRTIGQRTSRESLLGRVFESNLGDLNSKGEDFRKFSLKVDDVQGSQCLTSFYGMDMTTDKLRSIIRKKQTLIEGFTDVKSADGYVLRLFTIATTKRRPNQQRVSSYATAGQVRQIRKKMVEIVNKEVAASDISSLVTKLASEAIGRQIEKQTQSIYPLQNVFVRKVKVLRAPKADLGRLVELHGGVEHIKNFESELEALGAVVDRPAEEAVAEEVAAE
jgi:small subunit ribosomal protein S3Ae